MHVVKLLRYKRVAVLLALVFLAARLAVASPADDELLTFTGQVLLPDGGPASKATLEIYNQDNERLAHAHTDGTGKFEIRHGFLVDARVQVRSADARLQTTYRVNAAEARRKLLESIELKLSPAISCVVKVSAGGQPVAGAHVAALGSGTNFAIQGVTGADGSVELLVPATEPLTGLAAWHPQLGIAGMGDWSGKLDSPAYDLALLKPAPHTVRIVDAAGKGVPDLPFSLSASVGDRQWISCRQFLQARLRTNAQGEAVVPWMPAEGVEHVEVNLLSDEWKRDEIDNKNAPDHLTTVTVRPHIPVTGKLTMPADETTANPTGLLIQASGFGPGNFTDVPAARVRSDGSFTLPVASDHGFVIGVNDLEWTSDLWTGLVLPADDATPAKLHLSAYRATPVEVVVTRGAEREPAAGAWIEVGRNTEFSWTDATGQQRHGTTGVDTWLRTDERGIARGAAARGVNKARVGMANWNEEREFEVKDLAPATIEFHRPWLAERKVAVTLTHDGHAYRPSRSARIIAWGQISEYSSKVTRPALGADGRLELAFDAPKIGVLILDPEQWLSGYAIAGPDQDALTVDLTDAARFSGVATDRSGKPQPDVEVQVRIKDMDVSLDDFPTTDAAGRFTFDALPAGVPLWLSAPRDPQGRRRSCSLESLVFEPGEVRADAKLAFRFFDEEEAESSAAKAQTPAHPPAPPAPLAERLVELLRDARLAHMHALVIAEGDDASDTTAVTREAVNSDNHRDLLAYRVLVVPAEEAAREAAYFAEHEWAPPAAAHISLYALDGDGRTLAQEALPAADREAAVRRAAEFVAQHAPHRRDAEAVLAAANDEAQRTGRRVWFVDSGPRCGPCFRLARWMDDHHKALEKDYIIVKNMGGVDLNAAKVTESFTTGFHGIPWYAIADADGKVLVTSDGPLGNVGYPTTLEDVRHLRHMLTQTAKRLTPEEIDCITGPLAPAE